MSNPLLPASVASEGLPALLAGHSTPGLERLLGQFYHSIAALLEAWVARRPSRHTQRAYREDVLSFVRFLGLSWPEESSQLLRVSIRQVQAFRDRLKAQGAAPKTINRRISSLSGFYKYLAGAGAELRLPVVVPNPAHAQFICREPADPRRETRALSANRARQLMGMPAGNSLLDYRDRAILKFYLYTGARLTTGCRLRVSDFHQEGDEATIRLYEKGERRRTIGLHYQAAQAVADYIQAAGLTSGPLFRPRRSARSPRLADRPMDPVTMYRLIQAYLQALPGARQPVDPSDGSQHAGCLYTPHSLRATTATLLLGAGVDIRKVQDLLGHRHITTTQVYDKRRRSTSESASHDVPI